MGSLGDLVRIVSDLVMRSRRRAETPPTAATRSAPARKRAGASRTRAEVSPGESGPHATREVDPTRLGRVRMSYAPQSDGAPDPGEIVWTWVPFEENDGRGKDRPVLVVAAEAAGTYLALQLTSKNHQGEGDFVSVGAGGWDGERRPSWVNLDRVIRVHEGGMRRESTALPREPFERVTARLRQRYGWR
ncbi:PemK-like, MazF-like toxin of type II toxin-antitoxin system [Frankia sp. EI5c]|uniref:type II toxin-antitoxin system PemK/MazF family toxin n=1 Tax=Frankia sp. EI5c TaxID=683316 RepID=UPI0007C2317B|nr:type II toxin-antitoxin system PemK/MazF family toxin [Frankia sp. EI5c]OAA24565.1 PemK-like, MazF-like toxin of type II toxin-antitoxin system [Frankia sp. EI5c]